MRKLLLLVPLVFLLAACSPTYLIKTQLRVVEIPEKMFDSCPVLKKYSHNWKKLTDPQVASVIIRLYENNTRCHNAIEAIRNYYHNSKEKVERI